MVLRVVLFILWCYDMTCCIILVRLSIIRVIAYVSGSCLSGAWHQPQPLWPSPWPPHERNHEGICGRWVSLVTTRVKNEFENCSHWQLLNNCFSFISVWINKWRMFIFSIMSKKKYLQLTSMNNCLLLISIYMNKWRNTNIFKHK